MFSCNSYDILYIGIVNNENKLIGASLILTKEVFMNSFVIDRKALKHSQYYDDFVKGAVRYRRNEFYFC